MTDDVYTGPEPDDDETLESDDSPEATAEAGLTATPDWEPDPDEKEPELEEDGS